MFLAECSPLLYLKGVRMFNSKDPREVKSVLDWQICKLDLKESVKGWKSGPHVGVFTHWIGRTVPCSSKLTDGVLPCRLCSPDSEQSWTGYLPIRGLHGEKDIVMFGRREKDGVARIPYASPIVCMKGRTPKSPIKISIKHFAEWNCPFLGRVRSQDDIRPFLLKLWKDRELIEYFGLEAEVIPVPENETLHDPAPGEANPMFGKMAQGFTKIIEEVEPHDVVNRIPSKNGKHRSKK